MIRSLRGRVALAAAAAAAVVMLAGGTAVLAWVAHNERDALDSRLSEQAQETSRPIVTALNTGSAIDARELAFRRPDIGTVLRVYQNNQLLIAIGSTGVDFPETNDLGYSTANIDGKRWRMLTTSITSGITSPVVVQSAVPTEATDDLITNMRLRVFEVGVASALLAGVAGWLFGGVAMRPLARLRSTADSVSGSGDLSARVPESKDDPDEVNDLTQALNSMLAKLESAAEATQAALESSRAFAGNAAHEMRTPLTSMQANLEVLAHGRELPDGQRQQIIDEVIHEQARLTALLDALHVLARGEVVAEKQREVVDLRDVVGIAVQSAKRRYSNVEFIYELPVAATEVLAWPEGLRVMIDNLLINAVRHGGSPVKISVTDDAHETRLIVADSGRGISPTEGNSIFERFYRGSAVTSQGSGLGLALVAQQARIHGGSVYVYNGRDKGEDPAGAHFVVTLPAASQRQR